MASTWIFQANPSRFDISGYFATLPVTLTWLVRRYVQQIAVGDQVFIWRAVGDGAGQDSGVIAEAEVLLPTSEQYDDEAARKFWIDQNEGNSVSPRVRLRLRRLASRGEVLQRRWLLEDPVLNELTILKMANGTNYQVPLHQAARLNALWSRVGQDWTYAESVAGLWAYHSTYGGEVSRLPGSPVADVAALIGRAVSGCYNKVMNFRHIDPRDPRQGLSGAGESDRNVWAKFFDAEGVVLRSLELEAEFKRLWQYDATAIPVGATGANTSFTSELGRLSTLSLDELLDRYSQTRTERALKPAIRATNAKQFVRDALVVAIARTRANSRCEVPMCAHAQFLSGDGLLYTEVHHIDPLADGGEDTIENVVCLCPSHHREAHFGKAADKLKQKFRDLRSATDNSAPLIEASTAV